MELMTDVANTIDSITEKPIVIKDCSAEDVAYYIDTLENRKILGHYNGIFPTNKINILRYCFEQCSFLHDNKRNILYVKQDDESLLDKLSEFNASYTPPKTNSMKSSVDIAYAMVIEALEKQNEINQMPLIQGHRKCVLGRDTMYSDNTLRGMTKEQLIHLLHVAQHNYEVVLETLDNRVKYYEKELARMSDELVFEDEALRR